MKAVAGIITVAGLVALVISWKVYQWNDCKMVGHSTFYCIMSMGR